MEKIVNQYYVIKNYHKNSYIRNADYELKAAYFAVQNKLPHFLTLLIQNNPKLCKRNTENCTVGCKSTLLNKAMHKAYNHGERSDKLFKIISILISNLTPDILIKTDILNTEDDQYRTPLSYAAQEDDIPTIQSLLSKGANIEKADALYYAMYYGNIETTKLLLNNNNALGNNKLYEGLSSYLNRQWTSDLKYRKPIEKNLTLAYLSFKRSNSWINKFKSCFLGLRCFLDIAALDSFAYRKLLKKN